MNTKDIISQDQSYFARFVGRGVMLTVLLLTFVVSARAQKYYVMYYVNDKGSTQYLAINESGTALLNTSTLSLRCYWVSDSELVVAKGSNGENVSGSVNNNWNQDNRKTLRSFVFPTKYLTESASGTQSTASSGTSLDLRLNTSATARWLLDNENENTPVLYQWYYKHYVYYDNSAWKYSSNRTGKSKLILIQSRELLPPPSIFVTPSDEKYQVRMSAEEGCSIYYTTNGSMPSTNSNLYSGVINDVDKETTIKAFVVRDADKSISSIAEVTLPKSSTVILDDRENHNWTYYAGVDNTYNTNYEGKLYSAKPRNVKITYQAGGITLNTGETGNANAAVGIDAPQTSFIYYKTLESKKVNNSYTYPYATIPNPFSKRPSKIVDGNTKMFYGFGGWKITQMIGCTITGINGTIYSTSNGQNKIPAETEFVISFTEESEGAYETASQNDPTLKNHISAELTLEAIWVPAQVTYLSQNEIDITNNGFNIENKNEGVTTTYENNFLVIDKDYSESLTIKQPCTITMIDPDGGIDRRFKSTFTGSIIPLSGSGNNTKIEYTNWEPTASINAMGRNFAIGRGMIMNGSTQDLYASSNTNISVNQIFRVESGKFKKFSHYNDKVPSTIEKQCVVFGCDFDRANMDNSRLTITESMTVANSISLRTNSDDEICRVYSLSGSFLTEKTVGKAEITNSYYLCSTSDASAGHRYFEILGGEWMNIAGGWGNTHEVNKPAFTFRMRGGKVKGSIYGAAEWGSANGTRTYVITGGTINGWVAGGANGTRLTGGIMDGVSNIYIGGNAQIDSRGNTTPINRALGGNIFGAGCGYCDVGTSGEVTLGTNIVIADNAYIERGVYGGGSFGFTESYSNIYITGGTIGGLSGGVNATETGGTANDHAEYRASYSSSILGGVYGGACQNKGGNVNIYMTGGTVNGGIYGGSNASGTLSGNVNIKITGGTIGGIVNGNQTNANVYGGGYGIGTTVNGSVTVTLDNTDASKETRVNGDVYGGGAQGKVNKSISVNVNAATINGNLYGGGHGTNAKVTGNSTVAVSGGSINNVFGGGNAAELSGNSTVTITGGTITGNVYGGGNQAEVKGQTKVVIGSNNDQQNSSN